LLKRILIAALVILSIWLAYEWMTWPDVARLATEAPKTTSFMEIRRKELRREGKSDALLYTWVPYGAIASSLRRAVLVAEDDQFYEHDGVDVKAMQEAIKKDWERKKITHGGSTITQQLAKNLYLSPSRNPLRKLKEYLLARSLERHLTKKRILELYLNVVEMGERVYGAEAASQLYFRKHASDLSPQQAALLAGALPNPRIMNPGDPNRRLRSRQAMILSRLRRWGYLFEREVLTAPKPEAPPPPPTETAAPATDTDLAPEPTDTTATTDTTVTETGPPVATPQTSTTATGTQ
jgi:monofunctional biosynthetic peptidoglycan transglycosylase